MKNTFLFLLLLFAATNVSFSTTYTITNSGFTFSPSSITINLGDTVNFVVSSIHFPRQVSQSTWDANGNTSNGGFDLPAGGGTVILTQTGICYYVCVPHASMGMKGTITVNSATDVKSISETTPNNFILMQNYPNPFNPSTIISYSVPKSSFVTIKVYDALGRELETLVDGVKTPGNYKINFNMGNLASGVYFYELKSRYYTSVKKMLLLK